MRGVGVLGVAKALGLDVQPARGSSGGSFRCPACDAQRRHTKTSDKRGSAGVRNDGRGWRCFQCDVSGDALNLVAYALRGASLPKLNDVGTADVRTWCESWLGLAPTSASSSTSLAPPLRMPEPPAPPRYPPIAEVRALWDACRPVTDVAEVADWLISKRLDPQDVADRDLARALRPGMRLPPWARIRGDEHFSDWLAGGYLLIAQLTDARGEVRSVLARNVRPGREPKSRAAGGYERRGLVLACPLMRQVLSLGARPTWWPADFPLRFEIAEGEKKWIMRATLRDPVLAHAPACIGIECGSWTAELASRIPDGSSVFVATDPDDAGAKYATTILRSLVPRIADRTVQVELHPCFHLVVEKDGPSVKVRS
jgi:hypothetical protein